MCTRDQGQGTRDKRQGAGGQGKARFRLGGRASLRVAVGCGLLVALSPPTAQARPRLEATPSRPARPRSARRRTQVRQHQAALGTAQGKLSAASAELSRLQTQAEVLIERYDQAQVNEQRAASAYQVTQARLRQANRQQVASRLRVPAWPPGSSSPAAVSARRAYRCRPPGGLTEASGPDGLSWLSTWP